MVSGGGALPGAIEARAWTALRQVPDPELPLLTVVDLGIIRHVRATDAGGVSVGVAPTYLGCPATAVIEQSVGDALRAEGFPEVTVQTVLDPPWTTDFVTEDGRRKLQAMGIVPPDRPASRGPQAVACPQCGSPNTSLVSTFGSTPCKALHRCDSCLEPFERFKCL
jgi:ring-1,2-phenylacetyl-CoA epoxidase subunit PaaD